MIRNLPELSVIVPFPAPTSSTDTPLNVFSRFLSVTVPVRDPEFCASVSKKNKSPRQIVNIFFILVNLFK